MLEKLSIVIPAYNAESYIGRCLDSILDQDYHNDIEIIVVNDGSADSTSEILEKYQQKYPSIFKIITKENGGVSSARNTGLEAASGDWIWFCDADDYICKNGLSYVLDHFIDSDIDVCSFWSITLDHIALKSFVESVDVTGNVFFEGSTLSKYKEVLPVSVCNHLYRISAICDVKFRNIPIGEDAFFNLEVYMKNLRLRCTDANIYRYTTNAGQATRKRDRQTMRNAVVGYEKFFDAIKMYQIEKDPGFSEALERKIASTSMAYMSRVLCADFSKVEFAELIQRLRQKGIFPFQEIDRRIKAVNLIGKFPFLYPIGSFVYKRLFVPYILPKLSRN